MKSTTRKKCRKERGDKKGDGTEKRDKIFWNGLEEVRPTLRHWRIILK